MTSRLLLLLSLFFVTTTTSAMIDIPDEFERINIGDKLSIYMPDKEGEVSLSMAEILFKSDTLFQDSQTRSLRLEGSDNGYWIKGKIPSGYAFSTNFIIRLESSYLGDNSFFIKDNARNQFGEGIIQNKKQLRDAVLAYNLIVPPQGTEFLIYVHPEGVSHSPTHINAYLYQPSHYDKSKSSELAFFFILFGFIIAMLGYNLILYLYVGYKPYIYYCGYLASLFVLDYVGVGMGNTGNILLSQFIALILYGAAPGLAIIFLLQFGRSILNLSVLYPRSDRLFKYCQFLWLLCIPFTFIRQWETFNLVLIYSEVFSLLLMAVIAYFSYRHKKQPAALIFSISFLFLLVGAIVQLSISFIPYQAWGETISNLFQWADRYLFHLFTMIEMLLLSVALSTFIRQSEQDKQLAQNEKLELMQNSLVLKEQYSSQLEEEVGLRTNELSQKNNELEKLQILRDRFFNYITHEFRTPLTLAIGPLSEVSSGQFGILSKPLENAINLAERNARKMLNLVNLMLDLARQKNTRISLSIIEIDVVSSLNSLIVDCSYTLTEKNITLTTHNKTHAPYSLWFDNYYFESIFTNLLANACKHTPSNGKIDITYMLDDEFVHIDILNSGSVIQPLEQQSIFDNFYKEQGDKRSNSTSSGIGLALVKEFIELHSGVISVTSNEKLGTLFSVKLKLGKQHLELESWVEHEFDFITEHKPDTTYKIIKDSSSGSLLADSSREHEEQDKSKILLVDDNEELRSYLAKILTEEGYNVIMAEDGEQGYLMCQSHLPDILISDVIMPNVTGLELIKRVRLNSDISHIPIILLTAESDKNSEIDGIEKGADYYLTKPFVPRELRVLIQRIYQQRQLLKEKLQLDHLQQPTIDTAAEKENIKSKALVLIHEHISDPSFGVEQLAELLHMNRSTLHRQLKDVGDISANKLILNTRLGLAKELLLTNERLVEVAYAVGFNSQSYFSKKFHDKYKQTPSEWKKESANN
ncbi:MAG: hypothetical protein COA90_09865 [Gammaproteobacteria bacterium]|nr:MAG: hypothetical protein COA90_09865 [Gammaproteobacteria bacterium]